MNVTPDDGDISQRPRRWIGVSAALIAVAVLVFVISQATTTKDVVASPSTTVPPPATSSSEAATPTSTPATSLTVEPVSLQDLVPGIEGVLHALVGTSMRQLSDIPADPDLTLLRPADGSLGFATSFAFDASDAFLAFVEQTQGMPGVDMLNVWSETAMFGLGDLGVTSFQWHQTEPGSLAAITVQPNGFAELQMLTFDDPELRSPQRTTITDMGRDHSIVGWADYGFLIGHYDPLYETDVTTRLDTAGALVWQSQNMTVLDPSADRALVLRSVDGSQYVYSIIDPTDPDAVVDLELPSNIRTVTGSAWSSHGQLAVHYPTTARDSNLRIFNASLDVEADVTVEGWRVWDLAWGADSRFILMPGTDDAGRHAVIFYDTESQEFSYVDFPDWVQWADLTNPGS